MLINNGSVIYGTDTVFDQSSKVSAYMTDAHACCNTVDVDDVCQLHCDLISQLGLFYTPAPLLEPKTAVRDYSIPRGFLSRTISPDLHPPIT